jgi:PAS domain S-box-containing protein
MIIRAAKQPLLRLVGRQTGVAAAFLVLLANTAFAVLMFHEVRRADDLVVHTQQLTAALLDVRGLVRQAGSNQRTYLLTRDPQFLAIYQQAELDLPPLLEDLRSLVSDNAAQSRRATTLAAETENEAKRLAAGIAQREASPAGTMAYEDLVRSKQMTDRLADSIGPILVEERGLLQTRIGTADRRNVLTLALIAGATVLSVVVIGMMLHRTQGEARARSSELAETDAALRDSELRFRRMFEESPIGVLVAEADGERIVEANPAFCRMLGYEPHELPGRSIADIAHIDDHDLVLAHRLTTDPGDFVEVRYLTRSGVVVWARVRTTSLATANGHDAHRLCLVEDVTRQKQAEAELRQAQKMEAIGQLSGGIAHDFNNLLGVIIGNVEFLIDAVQDNPDNAELAREILSSALSGADLTRRLLAFARRQTLQPRMIDLNGYLPNHISILRRLLGESIQMTTTLAGSLWPIRVDPSQVGDALLNLAINARDAMPHGGTISIETANAHLTRDQADVEIAPGDYVTLSMTDTGIGMAPELLARVVEPFFTTKGTGAGSGLGLSMIYGFAKQSGGHLQICSELGHGTTVRLYLPRALGEEPVESVGTAAANLPQAYEAILLVDDNVEMRAVARRHLTSLGYRVSEAGSGPAALAILMSDNGFNLLFTDVVMPDGMTGFQLAAMAQKLQPALKVLFTTGYARSMPSGEPLTPYPGAMLRKPYRRHELAATVRAALAG